MVRAARSQAQGRIGEFDNKTNGNIMQLATKKRCNSQKNVLSSACPMNNFVFATVVPNRRDTIVFRSRVLFLLLLSNPQSSLAVVFYSFVTSQRDARHQ